MLRDEQGTTSDSDTRLRSTLTNTDTELATRTFARYARVVYCLVYVLASYLYVL